MFRTTFHNTVTDPIPVNVDSKGVVDLLHDHSFLITMSPIVTRHSEVSRDPVTQKVTYDVWENLDLLPFGLWKYELRFTAAFENKADGVITHIEAPMGFQSKADYTVRGKQGFEESGAMELNEAIESSCSHIFRPFVEWTMVPVRRKMHAQIIARAHEMQHGIQS
ncbi:hypothetical protein BAUCODRAFT_121236 [Baudoinia panamericana UAMH 10762]|uniref:DUF7053 domain-containing protein n=1 Tax=Baudoinia panamericana (strain UAMH 10762) TaxID=717646 RepID=M2NH40_BAUPA|nr:uncharacterized protein BAUCODRAFT_121236 [Baudoinia panamericana UAMH 10762]EMC98340.1 hypothetical protein BAUCODRAFT_121236 [Baudoinia panamericana UAMH 10762]